MEYIRACTNGQMESRGDVLGNGLSCDSIIGPFCRMRRTVEILELAVAGNRYEASKATRVMGLFLLPRCPFGVDTQEQNH
jgi:hypothetical protein